MKGLQITQWESKPDSLSVSLSFPGQGKGALDWFLPHGVKRIIAVKENGIETALESENIGEQIIRVPIEISTSLRLNISY